MLDIKYIRENLEKVRKAAGDKNRKVDFDRLLSLDDERRKLITDVEKLRAERNELAKSDEREAVRERGRKLKEEIRKLEDKLKIVGEEFKNLMYTVPNVPDESVPVGPNADFNKLVKKGYIPLMAPSLVKEFTLFGNGQFPWGREEVYMMEKDELYLAGTAEVPVTAYFSGEVLSEKELPKKFVAFSPCFRREAGSYGKNTKGLYRLHQFNKVEQVIINKNDYEGSLKLHEELLHNSEEVLQDLKLPYRVMLMSTGDMGEPQIKKYDVETYMPSRKGYGETMSNSFMGDFQTRRLNIRYRNDKGMTEYTHSLNNTAVASPRILIAILENYQQNDRSVVVPEILREYVGKSIING